MKPVKMTVEFFYDSREMVDGVEVGEYYNAVVVGKYHPGDNGIRWGHPDGWEEEVGHDFEVISAKDAESGKDIDIISERACNSLLNAAEDQYHSRR